jgi:hypothetical protein
MKLSITIVISGIFLLTSCGKKGGHEHHQADELKNNPNEALYNEVMAVHDEVMPKMDELYRLKKELKDKIANGKDLAADKKGDLNQTLLLLDSADHSMMDWMHKFKPLADSTDQEAAREYLENEMEKIRKVKELMNTSIEKAKGEIKN